MDALGWEPPRPWVSTRVELPVGRTAVLHHRWPTRRRPWSSTRGRVEFQRTGAPADTTHIGYRLHSGERAPNDASDEPPDDDIAPWPLLLILGLAGQPQEALYRVYYAAARPPKALWKVPGAGHTGARPPS
jgi:hypothetical protein